MTPPMSPNTQAILLLTAPLIAGRDTAAPDLLTPSEYKALARHLREIQRQPADLVSTDADEIIHACRAVVDESRLRRLLGRGFLLSQVIERWQSRAIWVVSRADASYPRRLKTRLREDAPAVLYGCGDIALLESGGLAVVGSRHVDDALVDYTMSVGRLAARAGRTLVSGGAKGIDQAAMRGALEAGGRVCGVLADSLERTVMTREHRNLLLDGQLTLISPYDPNAGFNVGNAMQRNKLIYALANAALVVSSDLNKGGTWTGATEQLEKLRFVPIYVRIGGEPSPGLDALRQKGALAWPNPSDAESLSSVFDAPPPVSPTSAQAGLALFGEAVRGDSQVALPAGDAISVPNEATGVVQVGQAAVTDMPEDAKSGMPEAPQTSDESQESASQEMAPAQLVFAAVREAMLQLLTTPMKDAEIAAALEVSGAQAKAWLQRLVDEGLVEKKKKPAGYVARQKRLFE